MPLANPVLTASSRAPGTIPDERQNGEDTTAHIHLACEVCAEEFRVAISAYEARSSVVECPRCGRTDLILLDSRYDAGLRAALG